MEEEPEIQEPISVEEQLAPENVKPTTLNKNGKPRKQLSIEALEKLQKARAKANAMRQQTQLKKLEEKVEKIKIKNDQVLPKKELKEETQEEELKEEPEEVEIVKEKPKTKPKGKKKTKIIVEQSSDDSDEFEPNDNVVFVKRVSRKKKEVPIVSEPEPQMELPPPEPPKPPRPELTPQQRLLKSQYEGMFGGAFMNNNLMRRHY
jgi:hypothetical protein